MTHSQESRVSSSQDTFRLTEESISRGMECTTFETRRLIDAMEPVQGDRRNPADYSAEIFTLPWKGPQEIGSTAADTSTPNGRLYSSPEKCVSALVNRLNSCLAVGADVFDNGDKLEKMDSTSNQDAKKLVALYPWLATFWDLCQAALGIKSIKRLEKLLSFFLGNVTANVKDCYMKPNRAAKLKKCMIEGLAYFHFFYQDIREPMENSSYLDKMTDLVSMYMDMEIKASRRRKESLKKIAGRLSSSLFIFLDNSEDHILDAILMAKLVNKHYRDVCMPLLGKVLKSMRTYPLYEMLYVRYLLVFKIWKKVCADTEERKHINKVAVQKLIPPPNFMEKSKIFSNVLPRIPKSKKNITLFFMQAKFNLKSACTAFLKGCKDSQQSGFSQSLSVNMDKPNFFSDRLDQVPDKENITNTGGSNLIDDIWSSLSNPESGLTENSQLQELSGNKAVVDQTNVKKKKDKLKKKQKKDKTGISKPQSAEKIKKKKLKKKISAISGDTASLLNDSTSLLKKCDKTKKKKKKKSADGVISQLLVAPCDPSIDESVCLLESNSVADSVTPVVLEAVPEPLTRDSIQTVAQVEVQAQEQEPVCEKPVAQPEVCSERLVEVKEETNIELRVEVGIDRIAEAETQICNVNSSAQVMVNQVNSAGESTAVAMEKETPVEVKCFDSQSNQVNQVNSAGCLDELQDQVRVTVIATGGRDSVVPSSSCQVSDGLATSHNSEENEAIATEVSRKSDDSSADVVLQRNIRDPILVPSQTTGDLEAVSYVCDSSIKNEIPISEEKRSTVGSDDFNSVPMEIDSDVEILAELRPQVTVKCGGVHEEEIVLSDDGEIMRQETQLDNIFATENADLVIEMLGGVTLQVPSMELNNSPPQGVGEPESPEMESFDVYDQISLTDMMSMIRTKADYSHYGAERRDCLYRDSMLLPATQNNYDRLAPLQGGVNAHQFMEDDECEEITSDDELESCYELNHGHSNYAYSKRPCIKGGKVGFNGIVSSNGYASVGANDKEVVDNSPSSSVDNENNPLDSSVSKNAYVSRSNVFNSSNDGTDTPSHPHVELGTPALSTARSPAASSTPKRLSDVNTMRYYTSSLDQPVQSESVVEDRTGRATVNESENKRPTPKKSRGAMPPVVDSPFINRRVSVQLTQLSPDSASGSYPDVVMDAHKVSGHREKQTVKSNIRGMLLEPSIRNKLSRMYPDNLYHSLPMPPPSNVPYPAMTNPLPKLTPFALGQYVSCTCSECYASHLMFLSNYKSAAEEFHLPIPYQAPSMGADVEKLKSAEKMKSEDEALLRRIERSLTSDTKLKTENDGEVESKFKPELDSSLPLKKRLKTLTHITETNVEPKKVETTQTDSFPSYPATPMISIAELDFNKSLLAKQLPRDIKTSPSNPQRYIPFPNLNYYQSPMPNVRSVPQFKEYNPTIPSVQVANVIGSNNQENPVYSNNVIPEGHEKMPQRFQQPVSRDPYYVKERANEEISNLNNFQATLNNFEYSGRQFKTPAQLKEIPPNSYSQPCASLVAKPDPDQTSLVPVTVLSDDVTITKQEADSAEPPSTESKSHVLDLSVEEPKHATVNQRSHRKKKKHSEKKERSSKRSSSRSHSVIQNADTVDDFMKSFEKKRRRKHDTR